MAHKVMEQKNGQKILTLPSRMAEAYDLKKRSKIKWSYIHKNGKIVGLKLEKASD